MLSSYSYVGLDVHEKTISHCVKRGNGEILDEGVARLQPPSPGGLDHTGGSGARRFDVGERSNPILIPMLDASLRQVLEWGVENIQAYCASLEDVLDAALEGTRFILAPRAERTSHLFGIRLPNEEGLQRVVAALREREVYVSLRGTSLRVSPHVYNTPDDIRALADALIAASS